MASRKSCQNHKRYSAKCEDCRIGEFATEVATEEVVEMMEKAPVVTKPEKRERVVLPVGSPARLGFIPCRRDIACKICR